jgi:AmiR/NasT family two-component response regulator
MPAQTDAILKSLRQMRCLVLAPAGKQRDALCDQLRHSVGTVEADWPAPEKIGPEVGIVIVSVADLPMDSGLYRLERKSYCLIGLVEEGNPGTLKGIIDLGVHSIINRPNHPMLLIMGLVLGVSISTYEARLRTKVGKLENNLRAAHTVERAVRILARTLSIPEDQAYQHLRTKAMDRREPMHELALQVINAHAILDDMTSGRAQEPGAQAKLRVVRSSEPGKDG